MKRLLKTLLPFLVIATISYSYRPESIPKKWRRFEMILSGLTTKDLKVDTLIGKYVTVYLQGVKIEDRRRLAVVPPNDELGEIFVAHVEHYVSEPKLEFDIYGRNIFPELGESVFENPLNLTIELFEGSRDNPTKIGKMKYPGDFRCADNADWLQSNFEITSKYVLSIYVSYRCSPNYIGLGCQHFCEDVNSTIYECEFETGRKVCVDPKFNNPPLCNSYNNLCSPSEDQCKNGGKCVKYNHENIGCICKKGYRGPKCEEATCSIACDPDFGECVGLDLCKCKPGRTGSTCSIPSCENIGDYCLNGGVCSTIPLQVICVCPDSKFTGDRCEIPCEPECLFGTCANNRGKGTCKCFDGFSGVACNESSVKETVVFDKFYVSAQIQKISFVVVTAILFLLAITLFGAGMYIRSHQKRNLKVIKGTEANMQTLAMAQQQATLAMQQQVGILD